MKIILTLSVAFMLVFSGCLNDDDNPSTLASQTEVAAKLPDNVSTSALAEDVVMYRQLT